jgi:hypothetical protein
MPLTLSNHCAISRSLGWGAGLHRGALTMIVGGWLPVLFMATPSPAAETREKAVAAAREGRPGIAALRKLLADGTDDPLVAYDLAVILTWVNRQREATDAFERAGAGEVPAYVLAPIVRAYRDQKRFAEAERWAREGERRFPLDSTDSARASCTPLSSGARLGAHLPPGPRIRERCGIPERPGKCAPRAMPCASQIPRKSAREPATD